MQKQKKGPEPGPEPEPELELEQGAQTCPARLQLQRQQQSHQAMRLELRSCRQQEPRKGPCEQKCQRSQPLWIPQPLRSQAHRLRWRH